MAETKVTTIGAIAFLAGVAVGALGLLATQESETESLDLTGDMPEPTTIPVAGYVNVTPDNGTILDSLEGIEVAGTEADLVKVRVLGVERAKAVAMWGSKGLSGDEPTKFQRLVDLTTEHLLNIKANSQKVTPDERRIIDSILEDRVAAGDVDADAVGI